MLKYWRIMIMLVCVLSAVFAIGLKAYPYGRTGVEVVYVSDNSTLADLLEPGMIIAQLNGEQVTGREDFYSKAERLSGESAMVVNNANTKFTASGPLGVDVMDIERTNLDFGLDIRGGTRIILEPEGNATREVMMQTISTLETRANIYGMKEIKFYPINDISGKTMIQIEAAGIGREIISDLLSKTGKFEAKITKPVELENGKGEFVLGAAKYPLSAAGNSSVKVGDMLIAPNGTFELDGIKLQYLNMSAGVAMFIGTAYEGRDIEYVYIDAQHSAIMPVSGGFRFYFSVLVSQAGAERFAKLTSGTPSRMDLNSGDYYLKDSEIILLLDGQTVSALRISADLGGKAYTTPQIDGGRDTQEEAAQEKLKLQTILRSGATPVALKTISVDVISPTLGSGFIQSALQTALLVGIVVSTIIFVRYRRLKITIPIIFTSFSEILIILGTFSVGDAAIWSIALLLNVSIVFLVWWKLREFDPAAMMGAVLVPLFGLMPPLTIDLAVIGGLIATIGTSVDHQIIITDETLGGVTEERKKTYTFSQNIARAFSIIMGSAATVIFAMLPLVFLVAQFVRGFAITIIISVITGILITRPAYAKLIENMEFSTGRKV